MKRVKTQLAISWHMLLQGPALATLAAGLLFTLVLFQAIRKHEEQRDIAEFRLHASANIQEVREVLEEAVAAVETANRLFTTVPQLTRAEFEAFTLPMLASSPYIGMMGYQRMVPAAEREAFERERRRELPGFGITDYAGGRSVPAGVRPAYRVLDYVAPQRGNESLLGMDAARRPGQEAAARRACASGKATMTGMTRLLLEGREQPGFLLLMPHYADRVGAPAARCAGVEGYTVAAVGSAALIEHVLANAQVASTPLLELKVWQGPASDPGALVYHHWPARRDAPSMLARLFLGAPRHMASVFEMAGSSWRVEASEKPDKLLPHSLGSLLMATLGSLGSVLAAAYVGALVARERAVARLVDERTAALGAANDTLQLLRKAIEASLNSVIITSAKGPDYLVEYVNPAFERLTGLSAAEVTGKSCRLLWGGAPGQSGVRELLALARNQDEGNVMVRTLRKDGSELWSDAHIAPCRDADGAVRHFVVVHSDITEKRRQEAELLHQATHDALTGLPNRMLFGERLHQEVAAARRHGNSLWVLFVDLDRFKLVNDSLGHRAGDRFLQSVAQRLSGAVRPEDTVARLGGDEFLLVLSQRGNGELCTTIVERIMAAIAHPVTLEGQEFFVHASVGISCYPGDSDDPAELVEYADLAMYRAKELGRNSWQFYRPEMNEQAQERVRMEQALRGALERCEFELAYQPQLDLRSGRVAGVEAQVCWRHPEHGLLAAERFMAVAEDTGLSVPIGAWALREACASVRRWQQEGHPELRLALNIAQRQFDREDLQAQLQEVLDATGLSPACVELELTERMVMRDLERALQVLDGVRALGVTIAVDHFGTGHASLAQLKRFPLDALKIDQSFVQAISRQRSDGAIPEAIIALAHNLGMRVVAEGVETEAQCAFLAASMCDAIQGDLYSPPLDATALGALLAQDRCLPDHLLRMKKRERTLLLVDDEPNILAALKRQLRGAGLRILTAPGGKEGLDLLEREQVDVIVSDQRMPGMTGVEFLRAVKNTHPETVRMVLSGFTELQSVTDAVNEGAIYKFLTKPWDDTQLRAHILEAFRNKEMADENERLNLEVRSANQGLAQANRQLEEVLRQQQEQISRTGISLDIVREALQQVPLPVMGLDEEGVVAFANTAAQALFSAEGMLLGSPGEWFLPALARPDKGHRSIERIDGSEYEIFANSMGKGTRARGTLVIFRPMQPAIEQETSS